MSIFLDIENKYINERNKPALFKKDFYFTVEETKKFVLGIITEAKIDPYNIQFLTFCNHYITKLSVDYLSKENLQSFDYWLECIKIKICWMIFFNST